MKKSILFIFSLCVILFTGITAYCSSDNAVYSSIGVYINHYPINSYCIDNEMCVSVDDLSAYGFNVNWNGASKSIAITRNYNTSDITANKTVSQIFPDTVGTPAFNIIYSDICVYVNNSWVKSYTTNGATYISVNSLSPFGQITWAPEVNAVKLWIDGLSVTSFKPLSVGHRIKYYKKNYKLYYRKYVGVSVDISYPLIETTSYLSGADYINYQILDYVKGLDSTAYEMNSGLSEYDYKYLLEDLKSGYCCEVQGDIKVTYDKMGVINIMDSNYEYNAGAVHGYGSYNNLGTFSLYTGYSLGIQDILNASYYEINDLAYRQFMKLGADTFFDTDRSSFILNDSLGYYLSDYGIVFFANPYNVACYAAGILEAPLYSYQYPNYYKDFEQKPVI